MKLEPDLIPFDVSDIPTGPYLVVAPHADDETMGMGGTIALASSRGEAVDVLVVTDGRFGGDIEIRKNEAQRASKILGVRNLFFGGVEDRGVTKTDFFVKRFPAILNSSLPSCIFLPSPLEYHPDHRATAIKALDALASLGYSGDIFLYEITRQSEANLLIDITNVIETKKQAMNAYESQLPQRRYYEITIALNVARTLTLPDGVEYAEAFWHLKRGSSLAAVVDNFRYVEGISSNCHCPLVSVIVRTKDRPKLFKRAISSILAQKYRPIEIVVVNDGGKDFDKGFLVELETSEGIICRYIYNDVSLGRAGAANRGLQEATGSFICFLDDDDEFFPDHLELIISHMRSCGCNVAYSKVEFVEVSPDGEHKLLFVFGRPFDRDELIISNYIPLNSLVFRADFIRGCSFDENFDLYEDWDLLIRLSRISPFCFLDKVTARYCQWGGGQIAFNSDDSFIKANTVKLYKKHIGELSLEKIYDMREQLRIAREELARLQKMCSGIKLNHLNCDRRDAFRTKIVKWFSGIWGGSK